MLTSLWLEIAICALCCALVLVLYRYIRPAREVRRFLANFAETVRRLGIYDASTGEWTVGISEELLDSWMKKGGPGC